MDTGSGLEEIPFVDGVGDGDFSPVDHALTGDFDGDGNDEVVIPIVVGGSERPFTVLYDDADTPQLLGTFGVCAEAVFGGDLNGDGVDDVIRMDTCSLDMVVNAGSSAGPQRNATLLTGSDAWRPSGLGDVNGDGLADLCGRDNDRGMLQYRPGRADLGLDAPVDMVALACVGLDTKVS